MRKLRKVTVGFVVQEYVQLGDTFVCVGQEFTCGDDVTWESPGGDVVNTPEDHVYQPFEMEQPEVPCEVVMGLVMEGRMVEVEFPVVEEHDGTPVRRMSAEELKEIDEKVQQAVDEEDARWERLGREFEEEGE